MATAELAVALPAVAFVLAMVLGGVDYGLTQIRCVDAARTAVRMVARGDPVSAAQGTALRALPAGASVGIAAGPEQVIVTATAPAHAASWLGLPTPHAEAVAVRETGGEDG